MSTEDVLNELILVQQDIRNELRQIRYEMQRMNGKGNVKLDVWIPGQSYPPQTVTWVVNDHQGENPLQSEDG